MRVSVLDFAGFSKSQEFPQIDVGFGDVVVPEPKTIVYPVILNFPKPYLRGYTFEALIAEKFEAMVKLGLVNSRMKDFYDVWLMARQFDFGVKSLAKAIQVTFKNRKTNVPKASPLFDAELYDAHSNQEIMWKAFLKNGQIKNAPVAFRGIVLAIESFLHAPVLEIQSKKASTRDWQAPGPWR